jgi:non-ribosomal peptide synthetase component E (peptide arylation enzyme)
MHGEYLAAARQLSQRYELTEDDVSLWGLPLIHNAGVLFIVLPVALERRTLVLQTHHDVQQMLQLIASHRVTFTGSIGPVAAKLLEIKDLSGYDLSSLRQFFALNRAQALETHLGIIVGQMFGMTEGMVFAAAPSSSAELRHLTANVADVRIVAMPDPVFGEKACAYIILQPNTVAPSVACLGSFLLGLGIAKYKLPERIEVIDSLPLTKVGKVDKVVLAQMIRALVIAEQSATPRP